jgi:regulator of ribonuclease activity A
MACPFVPTADLYDQFLDQARVPTGVHWKSFGERDQFSGVAFTIKCFDDNSRLKEMANTKAPGDNHILMVDAGGPAARCAVMGDLVARDAKKNGWGGVVIYGNVRDTAILKTIKDFGIVALGSTPQKSTRRGEGQIQIPIQIGDVMVRPGDHVYVDSDGVLILDPNSNISHTTV